MRWLKRISLVLVAVVAAAAVFGFITVRNSFPQVNGEIEVPVLDSEVTVHRDGFGIPHIYADNTADLFRAQGYVVAQDRFFQMDFWRHIGAARLSEMFGESQVDTDKFLRSLGLEDLARTELEAMPEPERRILEWYSEGVNAYLADHRGSGLSLEYAILPLQSPGYEPEPWEPINTLTWAKIMSWDLSSNFRQEIARVLLEDSLSAEQVAQLYPPYPADHPVIAPQGVRAQGAPAPTATSGGAVIAAIESAAEGYRLVDGVTGGGFEGIGSNNWVVSGELTDTGMPILANDPHLAIQMPSIWYEVGIHCRAPGEACPFDVVGFTFPGTPGVVIGHNASIAWGVTTEAADTQDIFIERVNPADPHQYEVDGSWVDMEVHTETIRVAGADDIDYEVRKTKHGPVISGLFEAADDLEGVDTDYPEPFAVSLAWQTLQPSTLVQAILGLNVASNWEEFRAAMSKWDIAAQNVVYADVEGNIGYQSTGEIPIRPASDGLRPVAGWDSGNDWIGVVPFEEMPHALNPERGYLATANQPVIEAGAEPFIGSDGAYGYRAARIEELILQGASGSVTAAQEMQMDERDGGAAEIVPHLLAVETQVPEAIEMQDLMRTWSEGLEALQARPGSAGAAAYEATWRHILELTFQDDLPEAYWPEGGSRWFEVVSNLLGDYNDVFWDDRDTPETETAATILEQAMIDAHAELVDLMGGDTGDWAWGKLHVATFENQTLGQSGIAAVEWLFNRKAPERVGGGPSIVNAVGWSPSGGYVVDWVPSMRMVVDLADLTRSTSIHTTGQSGHAFQAHYADMIEMWTDGEQHPMLWSAEQVEQGSASTLTMTPSIQP